MPEYFIGVDLGQKRDSTAIAIIERDGNRLCVRHVERLNLTTSYKAVGDRLQQLYCMTMTRGPVTLIMDATGVGLGIMDDMESRGLGPVGVTITSGRLVRSDGKRIRVPKRDLALRLVTTLESGRLKIANGAPDSEKLIEELLSYRVKIDRRTGQESFGAASGKHDDLVTALALACWGATQNYPVI